MRIRTLKLERYGPFTDRIIEFCPEAKLHVIYGPNEAGKSCALAAVTDLFFGVDRQTTYDFAHAGKELRIGATIMSRDGSCLTFRRRKGNKNTLVDLADHPIQDDALLPYLGSLTRHVFCNAFGLNTETLRGGAEEMLKGEGEVGVSLFAAASGMRGLADLGRDLEEEANAIFALRASKDRRFYQALGRFNEARKAIQDREIRASDWNGLNERIEDLTRRLEEAKALRGTKAAERARLSRSKRVAPLVRLIDRDRSRLEALGLMPGIPIGFGKSLGEKLDALRRSREACERIAEEEAVASRDHAEIEVDDALIARAGDVLRLFGETGVYASNRADLPRIRAETDQYHGLLTEFAARLGIDETTIETTIPTDAAQALIRSLILEGRRLDEMLGRHTAGLAAERGNLHAIEKQRAQRGDVINPRPLREKMAGLTPVLSNLQKRADTQSSIRTEARSLREAAARLHPPVTDLDALVSTAVPSIEAIKRFGRDIDALAVEMRGEQDRFEASTDAIRAAESKIQEIATGRPVPSAEIIYAKRQQRDSGWSTLRAILLGVPEALQEGQLFERIASFERDSLEADQLADSASSDAERVAAYSVESRRLSEGHTKQTEAKSRVIASENRQQEMQKSWAALWGFTGLASSLHPSDMISWRSALDGLLDRREKLKQMIDVGMSIDAAIGKIEPSLRIIAAEIGLSETDAVEIDLVASHVERRLQSLAEAWEAARDLDSRMSDVQHRLEALGGDYAETQRYLEEWTARWRVALSAIGMPAGAAIDEAEAALGVWNRVPVTIRERNNRARRVAGMQRNVDGFERQAKDLLANVAPGLAALPADAAVKMLNERLIAARAAETRRSESQRRLIEIVRARSDIEGTFAEAEAALRSQAAKFRVHPDHLLDTLDRLTERDKLLDALEERRTHLIAQGEGHDEDNLRAEIADFNSDLVESVLVTLAREEQTLEQEMQEIFAARSEALRERSQAEQGLGAEVAAQQRSNAEAELVAASRDWLVAKLGALLVDTVIDRRRASESDPLLTRAGFLFAMLTGNSFTGVGKEYDEHDVPCLVGRRPIGKSVHISQMSTGARDQFYLALRLAYLEDYAIHTEPAPFIGDDLFASFDEDRTAHGLAALTTIGDQVQPIVFSHHRHVAAVARSIDGAEIIVL